MGECLLTWSQECLHIPTTFCQPNLPTRPMQLWYPQTINSLTWSSVKEQDLCLYEHHTLQSSTGPLSARQLLCHSAWYSLMLCVKDRKQNWTTKYARNGVDERHFITVEKSGFLIATLLLASKQAPFIKRNKGTSASTVNDAKRSRKTNRLGERINTVHSIQGLPKWILSMKLNKGGITSNVLQTQCSQFTSHVKKLFGPLVFILNYIYSNLKFPLSTYMQIALSKLQILNFNFEKAACYMPKVLRQYPHLGFLNPHFLGS